MIDLAVRDQFFQQSWRAPLHLVDVDAGVEQKPLPTDLAGSNEGKDVS